MVPRRLLILSPSPARLRLFHQSESFSFSLISTLGFTPTQRTVYNMESVSSILWRECRRYTTAYRRKVVPLQWLYIESISSSSSSLSFLATTNRILNLLSSSDERTDRNTNKHRNMERQVLHTHPHTPNGSILFSNLTFDKPLEMAALVTI